MQWWRLWEGGLPSRASGAVDDRPRPFPSTAFELVGRADGAVEEVFMNEESLRELPAEQAGLLELGVALGQNHAFSLIAGRCSAAQAEGLRRLREEKLYKRCTEKWDDFCPRYLKISRSEADRTIKLWEEFGAAYFELSQLTRVSPETFRAIAPAIQDGALHYRGEAIELNPENFRKVAAVVAELRSAIPKRAPASRSLFAGTSGPFPRTGSLGAHRESECVLHGPDSRI